MAYKYKEIECITPEELDRYLAQGWYRLGQDLITLNDFEGNFYYWIRLELSQSKQTKGQRRVFRPASRFNIQISEWDLNQEVEALWIHYKASVNIEVSPSVSDYLLGNSKRYNRFDTRMITIRDGDKLVAIGYFDLGKCSVTSILHFYHPYYKKYSLGKLLLLLEIEYAKENGFAYYYTGYISLVDDKFDYKLFCGKEATEVYLPELDQWEPYYKVEKEGGLMKFEFPA